MSDQDWLNITVRLRRGELRKLEALAGSRTAQVKGKRFSVADCIREFIRHCVTDGGSWKSPNQCAVEYEARKQAEKEGGV